MLDGPANGLYRDFPVGLVAGDEVHSAGVRYRVIEWPSELVATHLSAEEMEAASNA